MDDGSHMRLTDETYYQMEADCGWGSSRPAFEGDFYAEPRDCTRNVPASFFTEELHPASFKACEFECGLLDAGSSCQMFDEKRLPRFDSLDDPPLIPDDGFFILEVTAVDVPTAMPGVLGNLLLDFFLAQVVGSVSKVNKRKFCFKAQTLCWNAVCSVKVRVYRREQGVYVVEFQRRSGDSVSFNHVFAQAVRYLQRNDYEITADLPMEEAVMPPPDQEGGSQDVGSEALKPILGMAAGSGPETQVECAEALALVAKDMIGAACLLRADELPSTVKELLKAERVEVALPTVGMLAALADRPQGCSCLSDAELVQLIRGWAVSAELSVPVQKQLAQILEAAERLPRTDLWATENAAYNSTILAH